MGPKSDIQNFDFHAIKLPQPRAGSWWVILRLYSPLQPFFDKSWRPSEIDLVAQ